MWPLYGVVLVDAVFIRKASRKPACTQIPPPANSAPRITPNGSPPRFSARYKGAELFVKKPSPDQVVIPSITTSSTTVSTLIKDI
ncbi:hypothetical protein EAG_04670 [Camponotus floridanus]|uniref:Uncharacterized protein n=1 Tax=Camponotus floridanus TaxID=104421 RepID=E2AVP9_CAMFO|nr:hypothetical protein EAG_04670 [Camponotus floridanus]